MKPLHSLLVRICTATILGLCVLLSAHSAPERMAAQADVDKLQDQVHALDKDVGVFSAKLDAQDKRIQDIQSITASQANHIGMVANHTTTLGNWIAWVGALITLTVFIGGLISFRFKDKAIEEAKKAAKFEAEEWFENHSKELQNEIAELRKETSQAIAKIHEHEAGVGNKARDAEKRIEDMTPKVFNKSKASELPQEDRAVLNTTNEALKQKPEAEFTAEDYFARGLAEYANERFESALTAFEQSLEHLSQAEPAIKQVMFLFAKGVTLGALNRPDDEIAVYNLIDQRYSADTATTIREKVAKTLVNKGVALRKLNRSDDAIAVFDLIDQRYSADTATTIRKQVANALFNKGITLGTLNRPDDEIAVYDLIDQRYSAHTSTTIREKVATALFNKGVTLGTLNRPDDEIAVYNLIDQRYSADTATTIREKVAKALGGKGVRLGTLNRPDDAIAVFDLIDQRYGADTTPLIREQVAKALLNKGVTLRKLTCSDDAIAVFDLIDQRYSADTVTTVREQVANALNGKGFCLLMKAKQHWTSVESRTHQLGQALVCLERALTQCNAEDKAMIYGNIGYAQFLQGNTHEAETRTRECLRLGRERMLQAQRADAQQHRVEPEDTQYEALLERLWHELDNATPSEAAT